MDRSFDRRTLLQTFAVASLAVSTAAWETVPAFGATAPTISSCTAWNARPSTEPVVKLSQRPVRILVHHTDTPNSTDYTQAHAFALSRSIQNHHIDDNHWIDTGQHFTNSRGGFVTEGRHQSLAALRDGHQMIRGAHCPGQNDVAIGIENEGNYMATQPPAKLWNSLVDLCAYVCSQYSIAPTEIDGHRDYYNTDCPGDVLYNLLPKLRTDVAAKLG